MPPTGSWLADNELHKAIVRILRGAGVTNPDNTAALIRDLYQRRGWKPPGPTGLQTTQCKTHPGFTNPCGMCAAEGRPR